MSSFRSGLRFAFCTVVVLLLTAALAGPAAAITSPHTTVYRDGSRCVQGVAVLDQTVPGGLTSNEAFAHAYVLDGTCANGVSSLARSRVEVYRWNGAAWDKIVENGWTAGFTGVAETGSRPVISSVNWGGSQVWGAAWFGAMAFVEFGTPNFITGTTTWRGGSVWSGAVFVP